MTAISATAAPPPAPVPQTGQTTCYDENGTLVPCAATGQDGNIMAGAALPEPRLVDNNDQSITDTLTGMTWTKKTGMEATPQTWQQALDYIKTINSQNYLGHDDWRLPSINELESLVNKQTSPAAWLHSQGFPTIHPDDYWTSSTYANHPAYAWTIGMHAGIVAGRKKSDSCYVWPVRTGQPGTSPLPQTGQTTCHDNSGTTGCTGTGQDGELQKGAAWPYPRFIENADQSMTDTLTGLVWSKDGNGPGPAGCSPHEPKTSQEALAYIACLNGNSYLGKKDWRLPNRNELASLVNRGQPDNAAWLNSSGFFHVQAGSYWTSTTYPDTTWNAWSVNMHDGSVTSTAKKHKINAWPVRNGQ